MKRTAPLLITALSGFVLIAAFFIPFAQSWGEGAAIWFDILASIAFVLGGGNLLMQHLKRISDKQKGWGYSGIIVVSFLITLIIGMIKLGSRPAANTEFYGESFVTCPVEQLPQYTIDGEIASRADGEPLPSSVRSQLSQSNGQIVFRGWMTASQRDDLFKYQDHLQWRAQVEELHAVAQVPDALRGQLSYHANQAVLSFSGVMSADAEPTITSLFPDTAFGTQVAGELAELSRRETTLDMGEIPASFEIPASAQAQVKRAGNTLTVIGPMSAGLRDEIGTEWTQPRRLRSLSAAEQQALKARIEVAGVPLNQEQQSIFEQEIRALKTAAEVLIPAINSAGAASPRMKTYRELYAEFQAGERFLEREVADGEDISLNAAQEQLVHQYAEDGSMSGDELIAALNAAGPFTGKMGAAIAKYERSLPLEADFLRTLCLKLLEAGDLSPPQRELLVRPYRELYLWRQSVDRLFRAAHQTKYAWSGDYAEPGMPFWWLYEYVFQPLLTTTFAVLAFYVAS
ncbi:MAG: hypothetical protein KDA58_10360, partial [Planctomycetaceae bacterium]|nr:hypothetical protein [Planctomycetaceae bacterium]